METLTKKILPIVLAVAFCLSMSAAQALAGERATYRVAAAEEEDYGEKKPVTTEKEARAALEEYYEGKEVEVGKIEEKELYFEAEVLDKKGKVTDRVIIDKRTGRVRSIY
jgi:uncharacterized membrane protein YkoI